MSPQEPRHIQQSLVLAIATSLILHGIVLFAPRRHPPPPQRPPVRLEASLAPRVEAPPAVAVPPSAPVLPAKPQARKRVLAVEKPQGAAPKWSAAQRGEMDKFLEELGTQANARPGLAQRSLAMARDAGRAPTRLDEEEGVSLESMPNAPPVDPFSLEMYLDSLVKKLNRSAAYVRNDPRARGVRKASVQIRLDPDGSLRSFRVIDAGDQQDEIAVVRAVVERAVPFAPFPADMRKSARSLAMVICIRPSGWGGGGFGFSRDADGKGC